MGYVLESWGACSPRERGWFPLELVAGDGHIVLPARAGVVPTACSSIRLARRAPRASGGGSQRVAIERFAKSCSPRERGWFEREDDVRPPTLSVLPARAAPRACGGGSMPTYHVPANGGCSPRERGWFLTAILQLLAGGVLPARAGVVPSPPGPTSGPTRAPRASGGGSEIRALVAARLSCSPRERGWFRRLPEVLQRRGVLPARAGVVPNGARPLRSSARAPRASGGGSVSGGPPVVLAQCSPRERGWFRDRGADRDRPEVLPARAGVVPPGRRAVPCGPRAPRASGGGSDTSSPIPGWDACSPRERGWFLRPLDHPGWCLVLPARAGVVPRVSEDPAEVVSAPRRERGWFGRATRRRWWQPRVLPARAGVVPPGRSG